MGHNDKRYLLTSKLCPPGSSICSSIFSFFFSKATGQIEAKSHMEPPSVGGTKVCSQGLGHMTKMTPVPYMIKTFKIFFFSGTNGPLAMGLGMQNWRHGPIIVCSHDDPGIWPLWKKLYKITVQKDFFFFLNSHHLVIVTKGFIWWRWCAPGLCTCMKSWKKIV